MLSYEDPKVEKSWLVTAISDIFRKNSRTLFVDNLDFWKNLQWQLKQDTNNLFDKTFGLWGALGIYVKMCFTRLFQTKSMSWQLDKAGYCRGLNNKFRALGG